VPKNPKKFNRAKTMEKAPEIEPIKLEENTFEDGLALLPVESSPRLDDTDEDQKLTFFNVVKSINNSPQKDAMTDGELFDLANIIINQSTPQLSEFNIEPHRISAEDISGGMEYEPSQIK
jgi:hypothetical protein